MITQRAMNYGKVLGDLSVAKEDLKQVNELLTQVPVVGETLDNPLVKRNEKQRVIQALFPNSMWNFMRSLCEHRAVGIWPDIYEAYEELLMEKEGRVKATLRYAMKLEDEDIRQIKDMICRKYKKTGVELELIEDSSLIGGMVLRVKNTEYDKSVKGTLKEMQRFLVRR